MSAVLWLLAVGAAVGGAELCRRRTDRPVPSRDGERWAAWAAGLMVALVGVPPVADQAQQHLWAETVQFSLLAFGAAPLVARATRVARSTRGTWWPGRVGRRRRPAGWLPAGAGGLAGFVAVTVAWRLPAPVDAASTSRAWLAVEAVTVVAGTWPFWADLVGSPARPPLAHPARRVALGALGAWSVWIFAWIVGMSAHPFYPAFAARAGSAGSQELAVGLLWVASAATLGPAIFANLLRWLTADQQASEAETALYLEARRGR